MTWLALSFMKIGNERREIVRLKLEKEDRFVYLPFLRSSRFKAFDPPPDNYSTSSPNRTVSVNLLR
jgi:hypothetical protein